MILFVIFLGLAFVLILLLWGGAMLLQGWFYQSPADHVPIRAAAGGVTIAAFLTIWCAIDRASPGLYDTLFEFSATDSLEIDSFETVWKDAKGEEMREKFTKRLGTRGNTTDFVDEKNQPWKRSTSERMAVAIVIKVQEKDKPPREARFNAELDGKGHFPAEGPVRYVEEGGWYITSDALGTMFRRRSGVMFMNILLNLLHFVVWWMVLWFGMRFSIWHAFSLALALFLFTMIAAQPLLFKQVRP